jgi:hypothetical protein
MANRLEHRLVAAANADLRRHRFVAPVDVLIGLGWLRACPDTQVGWSRCDWL